MLFIGTGSPGCKNVLYSISADTLMDLPCSSSLPFFYIAVDFSPSFSRSPPLALSTLTFIRQMDGEWIECWITDVCLWSLMVALKYNAIIYNPA